MKNKVKHREIKPLPPKLSKKCLFMLPAGTWLMSNTMHCWRERISSKDDKVNYRTWYEPIYLEQVVPFSEREEQWRHIKQARVNHRHYHLCSSKEEAYFHLNGCDKYEDLKLQEGCHE